MDDKQEPNVPAWVKERAAIYQWLREQGLDAEAIRLIVSKEWALLWDAEG